MKQVITTYMYESYVINHCWNEYKAKCLQLIVNIARNQNQYLDEKLCREGADGIVTS